MAKENILSTPRVPTQTADQMLESLIRTKNAQRQNFQALVESGKLEASSPDIVSAMEAANLETEEQLAKDKTLEAAAYIQGSKNIAKQKLGNRQALLQEGLQYVTDKVVKELIYESFWLDDDVKSQTVDQITDSIDNVMGYIEENCKGAKVEESKQSPFVKGMTAAIEATVKKAVTRICEDAEACDDAFPEFELSEDEENELDEKLVDLGRDEIVDLIKTKVAQVVQDEKEKGQERAAMFKEIENGGETPEDGGNAEPDDVGTEEPEEPTEPEEDEEETAAESAAILNFRAGAVMEGANWETLKIYFSGLRKRGSKACKEANRYYKAEDYEKAAAKYADCKEIFKEINSRLADVDDSFGSTVISYFLVYTSMVIALTDSINTKGGASYNDMNKVHEEYDTVNAVKQYAGANVRKMINYCDNMIAKCKKKGGSSSTKKNYKYSLESTMENTASERYMAGILEAGAEVCVTDDPTWGELKTYVSLMSKKIREHLMTGDNALDHAVILIDELEACLSKVPEDITPDAKEFVMGMVNTIYTAVPPTEIIISRFGNPMGSPDLKSSSNLIDWVSVSWMDLFVNIKTNLGSVKSYCKTQTDPAGISDNKVNNSECPVSGEHAIAHLIARTYSQVLVQNVGGSLFEAMMIGSIASCSKSAMESSLGVSDEDVEDAALVETLLHYNVFETLDTIGLYKFRMGDIRQIKRDFMRPVSEANATLTLGKDKKGLKKARINTKKMKQKKGVMNSPQIESEGNPTQTKPE